VRNVIKTTFNNDDYLSKVISYIVIDLKYSSSKTKKISVEIWFEADLDVQTIAVNTTHAVILT
jgi:hypothetical protein